MTRNRSHGDFNRDCGQMISRFFARQIERERFFLSRMGGTATSGRGAGRRKHDHRTQSCQRSEPSHVGRWYTRAWLPHGNVVVSRHSAAFAFSVIMPLCLRDVYIDRHV